MSSLLYFWGRYGKFGIIKFWIIFLPSAETNTNEYFSALPFISGSAASSFAFLIGPSLTRTVYLNFISLLFLAKLAVCYFSAFKIFPGPHSRDLFLWPRKDHQQKRNHTIFFRSQLLQDLLPKYSKFQSPSLLILWASLRLRPFPRPRQGKDTKKAQYSFIMLFQSLRCLKEPSETATL